MSPVRPHPSVSFSKKTDAFFNSSNTVLRGGGGGGGGRERERGRHAQWVWEDLTSPGELAVPLGEKFVVK